MRFLAGSLMCLGAACGFEASTSEPVETPVTLRPEPLDAPAFAWPAIDELYLRTVYGHIRAEDEAEVWEQLPIEELSLDSMGCYGTCPQYTVSFRRGGEASFHGRKYVDDLEGSYEARIYAGAFARLCLFVERFHVRDMQPRYSAPWTDDNTLTLRVRFRGEDEDVVVVDYGQQGPPELYALTLAIEEEVRKIDWGRRR